MLERMRVEREGEIEREWERILERERKKNKPQFDKNDQDTWKY